jgi:hypothetical protein
MAGFRIDDTGRPVGCPDRQLESRVSAPGPCFAIMTIAKDFQDLIRSECPRCGSGTGTCLVQEMRAVANGGAPD